MKFEIYRVDYDNKQLLEKVLVTFLFLEQDYPGFSSWYKTKVMPGLRGGSRHIYIATSDVNSDDIAAVMILKNSSEEKKICTLYVMEEFRLQGLGTTMVDLAMKSLQFDAPIITVSGSHRVGYEKLFEKFGVEHYQEYSNYYKTNETEHSYNGYLNT